MRGSATRIAHLRCQNKKRDADSHELTEGGTEDVSQKRSALIDEVIATIPESGRFVAKAMHDNAIKVGYMPYTTKSSKRENFYKIEYKKTKVKDPLYILHVNGMKWSFRCKLFHLDQYVELLHNLSDQALKDILESRMCKGAEKGCTAGIDFAIGGKDYVLCRHGMHFRDLSALDIPSVWGLLRTESLYRS